MRKASLLVLLTSWCAFAGSARARAPDTFDEDHHPPILIDSPQWIALELKIGPYQPDVGSAFTNVFGGDRGWMLNVELDVTVLQIPRIGQLNVAGGWGWSNYDAKALTETGRSGEETELTLYPLALLGVLRVDALARYTVVPLTFAGKLGYEWVRWKAKTGDQTDGSGFNQGVRWGLQAAFELDFFERGTARRLDEDWGVNHTLMLFEYYQSATQGTGDSTFQFGLGVQF